MTTATPKKKKTTKKTTAIETTKKKKTTKKASPKSVVKKSKGPKEISDQLNKKIKWSPKKKALFEAMKNAGAISSKTAATVAVIAEKGKVDFALVRNQLNLKYDLVVQGFVSSIVSEEVRGTCYYLTKKGLAVKFD